MISIQATKGQVIGAAIAISIGVAGIFGTFSYVNSVYAAAATHSVAQSR
ncbi:hypothetical protein [Leifsonia sp. fls2-241-R2A-40a]|nr:hypothetical protein [Leifsonia sp. fls2-241-R2A-40a]